MLLNERQDLRGLFSGIFMLCICWILFAFVATLFAECGVSIYWVLYYITVFIIVRVATVGIWWLGPAERSHSVNFAVVIVRFWHWRGLDHSSRDLIALKPMGREIELRLIHPQYLLLRTHRLDLNGSVHIRMTRFTIKAGSLGMQLIGRLLIRVIVIRDSRQRYQCAASCTNRNFEVLLASIFQYRTGLSLRSTHIESLSPCWGSFFEFDHFLWI